MADGELKFIWHRGLLVPVVLYYILRLVLITGGAEDIIRRLVRIEAAPGRGRGLIRWVDGGEEKGGVGRGHVVDMGG